MLKVLKGEFLCNMSFNKQYINKRLDKKLTFIKV